MNKKMMMVMMSIMCGGMSIWAMDGEDTSIIVVNDYDVELGGYGGVGNSSDLDYAEYTEYMAKIRKRFYYGERITTIRLLYKLFRHVRGVRIIYDGLIGLVITINIAILAASFHSTDFCSMQAWLVLGFAFLPVLYSLYEHCTLYRMMRKDNQNM